jgi:hypothetical protein
MACDKHGERLDKVGDHLVCWYCRKPYEDGFFGKKEKKK